MALMSLTTEEVNQIFNTPANRVGMFITLTLTAICVATFSLFETILLPILTNKFHLSEHPDTIQSLQMEEFFGIPTLLVISVSAVLAFIVLRSYKSSHMLSDRSFLFSGLVL